MSKKYLTITVPTYNIESYIGKCIESFKTVNPKYYSDFEVLIINDGSTDNSVQVVENLMEGSDLDLRIITKKMGGMAQLLIVGLKKLMENILRSLMGMIGSMFQNLKAYWIN